MVFGRSLFAAFLVLTVPSGFLAGESFPSFDTPDPVLLAPKKYQVAERLMYTRGYINDYTLTSVFRLGILEALEASMGVALSYFPRVNSPDSLFSTYYADQGLDPTDFYLANARVSSLSPQINYRFLRLSDRLTLGLHAGLTWYPFEPIVVPLADVPQNSEVVAVTSRDAAGGVEIFAGPALSLSLFKIGSITTSFSLLADNTLMLGKNWVASYRKSFYMLSVDAALQAATVSVPKISWLHGGSILVENHFRWWVNRGLHDELMPAVELSFLPNTTVGIGLGIPLVGGNVWRFGLGFTYRPGEDTVRMRVFGIHFPPDSADLWGFKDQKIIDENRRILDELATTLKGYTQYNILVVGNTSSVHFRDPVAFQKEQITEMIPLSNARAAAVKKELILRGIDPSSIVSIGKGGADPIVPFDIKSEQIKNRRVDIVLTRRKRTRE